MPVSKLVGAKVRRREDPRLIRGLGQYVDDINLPNTLHVAILRSPHAHARIKSIETDAARRHPGVVAVVTGAEIKDQIGTLPTSGGNETLDRKSTRLNSSHVSISYAVFCLKKKNVQVS